MKETIKQKQKEIIKLLKKELPKHGFFIIVEESLIAFHTLFKSIVTKAK